MTVTMRITGWPQRFKVIFYILRGKHVIYEVPSECLMEAVRRGLADISSKKSGGEE